ncbi:MAG: NAD-dependent malic enzyme [Bdellovibrionales bacterium]|nr:NAD-dependent malic enzyme [Bdellovibrionales bacterium]
MQYQLIKKNQSEHEVNTDLKGIDLLSRPLLNKGSAFTSEEREVFGLLGLLPSHISTIEEQSKRMYDEIIRKDRPLDQFIALNALQNRNEILFYKILYDHLVEFMPIVYTPTVGLACQEFSRIFRKVRGLWITPEHRGSISKVLKNYPFQDIRLIVATDNERILGLGDLGAGGIGIPIGKLSLYTVAAGIHPCHTLPLSLDVGTDNEELLSNPLYLGWRHPRLRGQDYYAFMDEFVESVEKCFPKAILQWEDFKKQNAFTVLQRYQSRLASFNDDIQGTAAVALAGILSGCRITGTPFKDQRVLMVGAGAAGTGISHLLKQKWKTDGLKENELFGNILLKDTQGILSTHSKDLDDNKKEFAWPESLLKKYDLSPDASLLEAIEKFKPTCLIGTSGQVGAFTKNSILEIAKHTKQPMIFPLSNPTSHSEATPKDLMEWTQGRAIVATGSPFDEFIYNGSTIRISQGNNVYIYPGVGLGALILEATRIDDAYFATAATTLASLVSKEDLEAMQLYPDLSKLREISVKIAHDIAVDQGMSPLESQRRLDNFVWTPKYPRYIPQN